MQRRDFIKTTSCLTCFAALNSGCKNLFISNSTSPTQQEIDLPQDFLKNLKNDKFYYKSKKDLPKFIELEACSLCQLNCAKCPTRKHEKNAPKDWLGYLKFKDFKKFVDDNDFETIELANKGEIFLNPELNKIIKYAHKNKIKLTADSGVNLNTVSEKTLENLVKYNFERIVVSIDGATPETYKIYRRGGDFDTVINNIKIINKFKKQYNSEFPKLIYKFIVFGHNEHEIELAKKKAKELNMGMRFAQNSVPEYSPIRNKKFVQEQTGIIARDKQEQLNNRLESGKGDFFPCSRILYAPQIDYNGDIICDCSIKLGNFKGNAFKQGFLEALNTPYYVYAKHMLTDLNIVPKESVMCTHCSTYKFLLRTKQRMSLK